MCCAVGGKEGKLHGRPRNISFSAAIIHGFSAHREPEAETKAQPSRAVSIFLPHGQTGSKSWGEGHERLGVVMRGMAFCTPGTHSFVERWAKGFNIKEHLISQEETKAYKFSKLINTNYILFSFHKNITSL